MKKYKYLILLAFPLIVFIAFKYCPFIGNAGAGKEMIDDLFSIDHSREIEEVLTKFDSIYNSGIEQSGAIGGAVVITYKGQIAKTRCFGVKKQGENNAIDENTVFRLASVSKTMTGVLAGILASEEKINLDDKVVEYLPGFRLKTSENTNGLTIRNLLNHSSGLVPHAFDIMVEDRVPLEQIMQRLDEVEIVAPPGQIYAYQNVMFSLFGPVIETKTKKSFETLMNERIFLPFGMENASLGFESFRNNDNIAFPHQKTANGYTAISLNNRYYNTGPAAGVNASISDLGKFLIAVSGGESNLFSKKAREIVYTPQIESPLNRGYYRNWDKIQSKQYATGWRIINYKNYPIAHHGGYVAGYQSEIALCEAGEIGIAVITNSPNPFFSESVPAFFNLYFDFKKRMDHDSEISEKSTLGKP